MHVTDLFFLGARNHPHRLALSGGSGDFTYVETQALSNRIARRLHASELGVGHKFAVMSPNTGPALIAMLGGMRAGLASARARGRVGGRKPKMTATKLRLAMACMGKRET